jgi:NOL1/NOP2/sun family putative RNA methylase
MKDKSRPNIDLPEAFLNRMACLLGDEYQSFHASLQLPALTGLRVNTLKVSPEQFFEKFPIKLSPVPWCKVGYIVEASEEIANVPSPGKHAYHRAGLYYLQEPSAMAAAEVLAPQPGEAVLDLAAAPGGKATHLATLMRNTGLLVANEVHPKRVWDLVENLERCGVTNAIVTNESPEKLADHFEEYFDRVLLDAPCSGEGMFRKSEVARQEWKPALVSSCAMRQSTILEQAARMVKPGGHLAYTTCTFSAEENEAVIAGFLSRHPEYDLAQIPPIDGFQPAMPEWVDLPTGHKIKRSIRIWPHLTQGEGHFIALLIKRGSSSSGSGMQAELNPLKPKGLSKSALPKSTGAFFNEFRQVNLDLAFDSSHLIQDGSYIYQLPESAPILSGLKVIRPGWWLGTINKRRFTPSHSLALGLKTIQARHSLPLRIGDPQLTAYLGGECLIDQGEDGWVLVTVDDYPLGWGKRVQNKIKNFYPRGLRQLA